MSKYRYTTTVTMAAFSFALMCELATANHAEAQMVIGAGPQPSAVMVDLEVLNSMGQALTLPHMLAPQLRPPSDAAPFETSSVMVDERIVLTPPAQVQAAPAVYRHGNEVITLIPPGHQQQRKATAAKRAEQPIKSASLRTSRPAAPKQPPLGLTQAPGIKPQPPQRNIHPVKVEQTELAQAVQEETPKAAAPDQTAALIETAGLPRECVEVKPEAAATETPAEPEAKTVAEPEVKTVAATPEAEAEAETPAALPENDTAEEPAPIALRTEEAEPPLEEAALADDKVKEPVKIVVAQAETVMSVASPVLAEAPPTSLLEVQAEAPPAQKPVPPLPEVDPLPPPAPGLEPADLALRPEDETVQEATLPALPPAAGKVLGLDDGLRVIFAVENSALPEVAHPELQKLALRLAKEEGLTLQLVAYASGDESDTSKARRLSLSRALAVRAYLMDNGVDSERIEVRALGHKSSEGEPDRVDVVLLQR
ncbi:OmpA family protein [Telmatospirillum sp. J64-1]|uniref:OmpA family protein n=1 Tax=Telmatospirillum sp. J64-1 TaxID=2502183 RepID=UPI00115D4D8B|nr:OmpA family protein [Telmatospirillum sp. J64-1]